MYKLIDYFVNRSLLVNLVSFIVVMIGIYSIVTLQKETFPMVDFETIVVRANYFGASAEDVEKLVTVGIERELKEIDGIEDMNALSGEGYSIIIIKIDPDFETDDVLVDVRNAVDSASDIPDDVEKISIRKMINTHRPIIKIAVMGDDEWLIRRHVRELRDELERIKGIAKVRLDGYRDEIIEVAVDKDKIIEKEVTLTEVARAIKDRNINISAGSVKDKDRELIVRTLTEYKGVKDIRRVVIRSNDFGENVKVMDISKVTQTLRDDSSAERAMGKSAIIMEVVAKSKADILNTTTKVKNVANNFFEKLDKKKISSLFMNERAFYVKRRLNVLTTNGLQGLTLVFICLMFFLNFKTSVITSLGAPLAFLVAFSFMQVCGVSINLISMFALILVLGMLVDDSIIVAENFYQKLEDGVEPEEAAKRAAKETLAPVSATILTTIVAFGTLFFLGGIMGKFLWPVPAVIIICLMASWFECFFILPSHLKDFVKLSKKGIEKDRWYKPLIIKYEVFLTFTLRHSKKTVIFFGLLLAAAINVQFTMEKELFPGDDVQIVLVKVKGKVGKPFARTTEVIKKLEKIIMEELGESEYENLTSVVGSQFSPLGTPRIGSHYGQVVIYLTMQDFRERKTEEIINQITQKAKAAIEGYELSVDKRRGGPPKGKPINVELSGESLEELKHYSQKIKDIIIKEDGVLATEVDYEEGKEQYIIKVNEKEARRLGLTNTQIALEVRRVYEGETVTKIRRSDEDIEVILRMDKESRSTISTLDNLTILNSMNRHIKLKQVATIIKKPGSFVIRRLNRRRTFSISGEIDLKKTNSVKINKAIKPHIEKLLKASHLTFVLAGENKDTKESMENFGVAAGVAVALIFIILVAMFGSLAQPLIILSAIPLGLIGVVFTFKAFGMPISFMALMGIIGLVGVVVNDSIVLVNYINIKLKDTDDYLTGIVKASVSRFRPVILTTFTTVAGLLPMAHTPGGDPFLKPMAISFAYGLIFSTTLTLVFVPACYFNYAKFVLYFKNKKLKRQQSEAV